MVDEKSEPKTAIEILESALEKEKNAYKFYDDLLKTTTTGILGDILLELKNEEFKHVRLIEKKIMEIRRK